MKNKALKKINKKITRASRLINFVATAMVVAVTVYTLIPKDEKITGIDENRLAEKFMPDHNAAV
ncbi:MAG: hypothetical protein ACI4XE_07835 [Acutalibacteraceae bacterium]